MSVWNALPFWIKLSAIFIIVWVILPTLILGGYKYSATNNNDDE